MLTPGLTGGTTGEVGLEEVLLDARILAVSQRGDRLEPLLASHCHIVPPWAHTADSWDSRIELVSQTPDEQALLRSLADAAVNGDNHALGELVRRTQPVVWRVCAILGSSGEVEDLVQETYLRAMRSLTSYRGDAPVQAWLLSIARNVCADHVRRRTRQNRLIDRLRAERTERLEEPTTALEDLVQSLDTERREAFVLTQVCGLSYAEAAEVVDCPIGTIRSRVARARADLFTLVEQAEAR